MKCTVCDREIQQDSAFCCYCGSPVVNKKHVNRISLRCEQCGGILITDSDKELSCPYCGYKSLIIENDAVTIERIKSSTHREIEREKMEIEREKMQREENNLSIERFQKGKLSKFLVIAFGFSTLFSYVHFSEGRILAGFFSLVQMACFGGAWCMGMKIIQEKKRYVHILLAIVGIILIIPTTRIGNASLVDEEIVEIEWSILKMGKMIPEPKSTRVKIDSNSGEKLGIDVYDMTEMDYYEYIQECEDKGYNIDIKEIGSSFFAYNESGYELHVMYLKDYMGIDLKCPIKLGEYKLPDYAIDEGLPLPKSKFGHYEWKYDDNFNIKVGDTTFEEYLEYVNLCIEAGFIRDSQEGKDFYNGDNREGFSVAIRYMGFNTMSIDFDSPK